MTSRFEFDRGGRTVAGHDDARSRVLDQDAWRAAALAADDAAAVRPMDAGLRTPRRSVRGVRAGGRENVRALRDHHLPGASANPRRVHQRDGRCAQEACRRRAPMARDGQRAAGRPAGGRHTRPPEHLAARSAAATRLCVLARAAGPRSELASDRLVRSKAATREPACQVPKHRSRALTAIPSAGGSPDEPDPPAETCGRVQKALSSISTVESHSSDPPSPLPAAGPGTPTRRCASRCTQTLHPRADRLPRARLARHIHIPNRQEPTP